MSTTKLVAQPRSTSGSPASRRLRAEGHIPAVLYGRGMTPISVTVERRELRLALSGPAIDRLKNSVITRVVVTNTLPLSPEKQIDKIEVLSIAPLIADALNAVFDDTSVSEIFGGENQS